MKCSKCGYISFDYNQVCPKCNKEISADQGKLNLPSFRPAPPSLLGALTGEQNESSVNLNIDPASVMAAQGEADADLDDSLVMDSQEMSLDEEEDLDIRLDIEDTGEFEEIVEEEITESISDYETEGDDEEISLDLEDFSTEESESENTTRMEPALEEEEETFDIDLDALATEEPKDSEVSDADDEESAVDLEDLDLDLDLEKSDD